MSTNTTDPLRAAWEDTAASYRRRINDMRSGLAALTAGSDAYLRAEDDLAIMEDRLVGVEAKLNELTDRSLAGASVDAIEANITTLRALAADWPTERGKYAQELAADSRYSQQYRDDLLREWVATRAQEAKAAATGAWQAYKRDEGAVAREIQNAHRQNEARFDLATVGVLVKDYGAQMQAPPTLPGTGGKDAQRIRFIAELLDRVEASGDPNAQRAARIAAAPEVQRLASTGEGDTDALSRELVARLARMTEAERGRVAEVEAKAAQLRRHGAALREAILNLESATGGSRGGILGISKWQASVLGETDADFGGGAGEMTYR